MKTFKEKLTENVVGRTSVVFDGEETQLFALYMLVKSLAFEIKTGMRLTRRVSAYTLAKKKHGLKGNKEKVYAQLSQLLFEKTEIDLRDFLSKVLVFAVLSLGLVGCGRPDDAVAVEPVPVAAESQVVETNPIQDCVTAVTLAFSTGSMTMGEYLNAVTACAEGGENE